MIIEEFKISKNLDKTIQIPSMYFERADSEKGINQLTNQTTCSPFLDVGTYFEKYENMVFPISNIKSHQR